MPALLAATYGWTPRELGNLSHRQLVYFHERIPLIEARRAYPFAQLEAALRNIAGGKPKPGDAKPKPVTELYTASELMPFYASFDELGGLSVSAKEDLIKHAQSLPSWALQFL